MTNQTRTIEGVYAETFASIAKLPPSAAYRMMDRRLKRAVAAMDKFEKNMGVNPTYAFEWADDAMEAAAVAEYIARAVATMVVAWRSNSRCHSSRTSSNKAPASPPSSKSPPSSMIQHGANMSRMTLQIAKILAAQPKERLAQRLERNILKADCGCVLFEGRINNSGYGRLNFRVDGRHVNVYAHRLFWVLANGKDVPEGTELDHVCCNRRCVNPNHLEVVTPEENKRRIALRRK